MDNKRRTEDDGCLPTAFGEIITEGVKLCEEKEKLCEEKEKEKAKLAKKSTQSSKKIDKGMRKRKLITEYEMREYVVKKVVKFAKKLESEFVWEKKIRQDLGRGVAALDGLFSIEALKKRRENVRMELEKVRERREKVRERSEKRKKIIHEAQSRSEDDDHDDRVQISSSLSSSSVAKEKQQVISPPKLGLVLEEGDDELVVIDSESVVDYLKKPKFLSRVRTGYQWNRYNRIHYDGDNPPPKAVQGYKFDILYPDLWNKSSTPSYSIERDDVDETCILRFHAGEPYQDIAFRIMNAEWDYSPKNGFKCTFESGILRLHFNLKRLRYRR